VRFLIFGAGVIGSLYATKFSLANLDVTLYARGKRLEALKQKGLLYNDKGIIKKVLIKVIDKLDDNDIYDYIFVPVRYDQMESALKILKQNKSKNIVTMSNSVGYNRWVEIIGDKLIPGFPGAGGDIKEDILYAQIGSKNVQKTIFGEINGEITERIKGLLKLFELSGIPIEIANNILAFHITHAAVTITNKHFYTDNGIVDIKTAKSKYILRHIASDLKNNLYTVEKAGIPITPLKIGKLKQLPDFVFVVIFYLMLSIEFTKDVLLGNHAINAKNEIFLLDKDFQNVLTSKFNKKTE
jgi:2-dehydropantoate 2-reductase